MSAVARSLKPAPSRFDAIDTAKLEADLSASGYAVLPAVLNAQECALLRALYGDADRFRSRVVMARHNFGQGEYQYLNYPLPPLVQELRECLYPRLAPIANQWNDRLAIHARYPNTLEAFLETCHRAGQT